MTGKPYIEALPGAWTRFSVMSRDDGPIEAGGADGRLQRSELKAHIARMNEDREEVASHDIDPYWIDAEIAESTKLLSDMEQAGLHSISYLPEELEELPSHLRPRATEMLLFDSTPAHEIDEDVLNNALARYQKMPVTIATMSAKSQAKAEIIEIAEWLGFELE